LGRGAIPPSVAGGLDSACRRWARGADREGHGRPAHGSEVRSSSAPSRRDGSHLWLGCAASDGAASNVLLKADSCVQTGK